jgi:hypothetical protein
MMWCPFSSSPSFLRCCCHCLGSFYAKGLGELGREGEPSLVEPGLDGGQRDAKFSGYLTVAQALQVKEPDRLGLAVRQQGDGVAHAGGDVAPFGRLGRARLGAGVFRRRARQFGTEPAAPAAGHVERDAAEPGAELVR